MSASQDPLLFDGEDGWLSTIAGRHGSKISNVWLNRPQDDPVVPVASDWVGSKFPRVARWRPFADSLHHPGHRTRLGKYAAGRGCGATAMYQKLVDQHSFSGTYN